MKKAQGLFYFKKALPAIIATTLVLVLPLGAVFLKAFAVKGQFISVLTDSYTWKLTGFTVLESALGALISILLALPFAAFFSRYDFRGRKALLTISDAAFALPAILVILGFVIFYGNNGILNKLLNSNVKILYSFKAIILALVYLNFPVAFSLITTSLVSMPDTEEKASMLLGASPLRTFFKITLPKLKGMLLSVFSLIFLFCFPAFLIVMTLGGSPKYYILEAEIYKRTYIDANPSSSASLALFSFCLMVILLLLTGYNKGQNKASRAKHQLKTAKGNKKIIAYLLSVLIILFMAPPLLAILYRAFFTKDGSFTLKAWTDIVKRHNSGAGTGIGAIINSLSLAFVSAFISTKMACSIALYSTRKKTNFITLLTSLPMATGSVTLGLGYAFVSLALPIKNTFTSYALVLLAHMVVVLPFAVKTLLPAAQKIPQVLSRCSWTLGASDKDTYYKIQYPMLKSHRKKAFSFAFALSLGEVNATLALGEGRITTLPVLIYKMINQYNYQGASALATILLLIAIIVFAIGETGEKDELS